MNEEREREGKKEKSLEEGRVSAKREGRRGKERKEREGKRRAPLLVFRLEFWCISFFRFGFGFGFACILAFWGLFCTLTLLKYQAEQTLYWCSPHSFDVPTE